jgi:hypothetical protein
MNSEPSWLDTYYAALEFVYWEPQHLGQMKNPDSGLNSIDRVSKRLHALEVTLNHNLDQFFRLAPTVLRNRLFSKLFETPFPDQFHLHGRHLDVDFDLANTMQPDFLFVSQTDVVGVEMKVDAKSSLSQVLKYALLGLAVEAKTQTQRRHHLVMLGRGPFERMWKEGFKEPVQLRSALTATDLQVFLQSLPVDFSQRLEHLRRIVGELQIGFLTYAELAHFLRQSLPSEDDGTLGAEVYRKLILGVLDELNVRHLDA